MKKITALLLVLVLAFSMTACGGKKESSEDKKDKVAQKEENKKEPETENKVEKDKEEKEAPKMEEVVVVDNDDIKISITEIKDVDVFDDYTINLFLENKTDKKVIFNTEGVTVNGIDTDALLYAQLQAGTTHENRININAENWAELGIENVTDIGMNFKAFVYGEEPLYAETFHYYPMGDDKAEVVEREVSEDDLVIMDNEYAKITYLGESVNEYETQCLDLYIENKTDVTTTFQVLTVYINGQRLVTIYGEEVAANSTKYSSIELVKDEMNKNGITQIDSVQIQFEIYNSGDWNDRFVSETVTVK